MLWLVLLCSFAAALRAQSYIYSTNDGAITIDNYIGSRATVTIPSTMNGLPVARIGSGAFADCWWVTNVSIPDSVTSIGNWAFRNCSSLAAVSIGSSVTDIGAYAFYFCTSLAAITIPATVTTIQTNAFFSCTSLGAITVDTLNPSYSSTDGVLFNIGKTSLIQCPGGKADYYTVPSTVTNIGQGAFAFCPRLTVVTLPDRLAAIGDEAFDGCSSLRTITIPNSVIQLGDWAFCACTDLTGICFKGNAPMIGKNLFGGTPATVYYLPGATGWGPTLGDRPTALWELPYPVILCSSPAFGQQNDGFGFIISWATNASLLVEACTSLNGSAWSPIATNTLADGWSSFNDPDWENHPARFYRIRLP